VTLPAGLTATSIDPTAAAGDRAASGLVAIDVHVQPQEHENWCWAAVASTISKLLSHNSPWSQCAVACAVFPGAQCCESGGSADCNKHCDLDAALAKTGNLKGAPVNDEVEPAELVASLKDGRPVCIRIEWDSGNGHFVLIRAASDEGSGAGHVIISDPIYKESYHDIADLNGNYLNNDGRWTNTYFVGA
jgi:hypothetical protein